MKIRNFPKSVAVAFWLSVVAAVLTFAQLILAICVARAQVAVVSISLFVCVLFIIGILQKSKFVYWLGLIGAVCSVFVDGFKLFQFAFVAPIVIPIFLMYIGLDVAFFVALVKEDTRKYFGVSRKNDASHA